MSLPEKQFAELRELLTDAEDCIRLTPWEENFLTSMRQRVERYGEEVSVSPAQWETVQRIQQKVYAT